MAEATQGQMQEVTQARAQATREVQEILVVTPAA